MTRASGGAIARMNFSMRALQNDPNFSSKYWNDQAVIETTKTHHQDLQNASNRKQNIASSRTLSNHQSQD